jgi:hypothetical protein
LEADPTIVATDFAALAQRLWPEAAWDSKTHALLLREAESLEITISDSAVHISWRGRGDVHCFMAPVAESAAACGFVLVDVQLSELYVPDGSAEATYAEWYERVVLRNDV